MNRACRGRNLEDALRADDLAQHYRGAMTPREEPEKLAVLTAVLTAVLMQLAVLLAVWTAVLMQLAVLVLVARRLALLPLEQPAQAQQSGVAGWESTVAQRLLGCSSQRWLTIVSQVSWRAMPEFSWRSSASPEHHRSWHRLRHRQQLFWHAWVCRRWARASNLFLQRDVARGRLAHRPCSSRACRHRHQFLRTSR